MPFYGRLDTDTPGTAKSPDIHHRLHGRAASTGGRPTSRTSAAMSTSVQVVSVGFIALGKLTLHTCLSSRGLVVGSLILYPR